jgi:hypothetical protein
MSLTRRIPVCRYNRVYCFQAGEVVLPIRTGSLKRLSLAGRVYSDELALSIRRKSCHQKGQVRLLSSREGGGHGQVSKKEIHFRKHYCWKPSLFSNIYGKQQPVIHLPELGAYASYSFQRWFALSNRSESCCQKGQVRLLSSRGGDGFKLDALTFSIGPELALEKFRKWSIDEQGLKYIMNYESVRIGAAYVPVWSFDVNIRYVLTDKAGRKHYGWKPSLFSNIYGKQQPIIYLPGLGAYAGYSFRRSLVHPVVNTTLVFMGDKTIPFEKFMLRDMKLANGDKIEVFPDPWNATRGQAFASLVDDIERISDEAEEGTIKVQTEIVNSRRVYLPIYLIDYTVLGMEYRAFTSGCDSAAGVSGVNHKVFDDLDVPVRNISQASQTFLSQAFVAVQTAARVGLRSLGGRNLLVLISAALQFVGSIAARAIVRIPPVAALAGLFVGFRKLVRPWMDNKRASAEWERQRAHDAEMHEETHATFGQDFVDNGSAQSYFQRNKENILRYLGGQDTHEQGSYDWYKDWEEWARRQWSEQQRRQEEETYDREYGHHHQQQQTYGQRKQRQKPTPEFEWDFDPNDPYSVLGLHRGATKQEVAAAYRREILKHHPDTQAAASEAQKTRAVERAKLINEAYRAIKASMKK